MRRAVLIGESDAGWETIALPDKEVQDQKAIFKSLRVTGGKMGKGKGAKQYKHVIFFDRYAKRVSFRHIEDKPVIN